MSTIDLNELIAECQRLKRGDVAFILVMEGLGDSWLAAIGNTSSSVTIGETLGCGTSYVDFYAQGATPLEAVEALHVMLVGAFA